MVARLCRFKSCHPHHDKAPENGSVKPFSGACFLSEKHIWGLYAIFLAEGGVRDAIRSCFVSALQKLGINVEGGTGPAISKATGNRAFMYHLWESQQRCLHL